MTNLELAITPNFTLQFHKQGIEQMIEKAEKLKFNKGDEDLHKREEIIMRLKFVLREINQIQYIYDKK